MKIKISEILSETKETKTQEIILNAIRKHSSKFKEILALKEKEKIKNAIKTITHAEPLFVFWVTPEGKVLDAKTAHRDNPPNGDKSIFQDSSNKGHLRGRAALIGDVIYIVIYLEIGKFTLTQRQLYLLRRSYPALLQKLTHKHKNLEKKILESVFITELGEEINI